MAIWYVDPDMDVGDETDSYEGENGTGYLRKSWADVTWSLSSDYYQKSGTTWAGKVTIAASGTAANPSIIGIYSGTTRAIINGAGQSQCMVGNGKAYLQISDYLFTGNPSNAGLAIWANGTTVPNGVKIRNCICDGSQYDGITVSHISTLEADYPGYATGVEVINCIAFDCGQHGIAVIGPYDGARISGCTAYNCSTSINAWGIYLGTDSLKYLGTADAWTDLGSNQYRLTRSSSRETIDVAAVIYASTNGILVSLAEDAGLGSDYTFTHNTTTITIRLAAGVTPNTGCSCAVTVVHHSPQKNGVIENCVAYNMDNNDGVAIGSDHFVENAIIRSNYVHDCIGPGISTNIGNGATVYGNKIENCGTTELKSLELFTASTAAAVAYNNTITQSGSVVGISCAGATGSTITLKNNLITGGATGIGENAVGADTVNASYNCITSTTALGTGVTDAGNNITNASATAEAGVWVAGVKAYDDLPLPLHPDIGAVQNREAAGRKFGVGGGAL